MHTRQGPEKSGRTLIAPKALTGSGPGSPPEPGGPGPDSVARLAPPKSGPESLSLRLQVQVTSHSGWQVEGAQAHWHCILPCIMMSESR